MHLLSSIQFFSHFTDFRFDDECLFISIFYLLICLGYVFRTQFVYLYALLFQRRLHIRYTERVKEKNNYNDCSDNFMRRCGMMIFLSNKFGVRTFGRKTFGPQTFGRQTFGRQDIWPTDVWPTGHLADRTIGRQTFSRQLN